jgi:hypothetical protein
MKPLLRLGFAAALTASLVVATAPTAAANTTVSPHSATFEGPFDMRPRETNYSNTCYTTGIANPATQCSVRFETPEDIKQHLCVKYLLKPATKGYWAPTGDPSKTIVVDLFWMGGGVLEGSPLYPGQTVVAYSMRIQILDVCGDAPSLAHDLGAGTGLDLAPHYRFAGHVDATEARTSAAAGRGRTARPPRRTQDHTDPQAMTEQPWRRGTADAVVTSASPWCSPQCSGRVS